MQTSTAGSSRGRLRADEVREILELQARSGVSLLQYCKQHRLPYKTIASWRRRLQGPSVKPDLKAFFVPVQVKPAQETPVQAEEPTRVEEVAQRGGERVEICLAHGRRLRVSADVDGRTLRRFVEILEAVPC